MLDLGKLKKLVLGLVLVESTPLDLYEDSNVVVSTVYTNELEKWETGISHCKYNNGDWIIVEEYETEQEAKDGHLKWKTTMTDFVLPDKLVDVSTSHFKFEDEITYEKQL